jgi:hypothetical protein
LIVINEALKIEREALYNDEAEIVRDPRRHEIGYVLGCGTLVRSGPHEIAQIPIEALLFTQLII